LIPIHRGEETIAGRHNGATDVPVDTREQRGYTVTNVPLLMYRSPVLLGGEAMKTLLKRAIRDEKGAALTLVLVLLVVGGLILTPLLGLMSTGLVSGQLYERKTDELYAADAGVEDAIWKIQTNNLRFGTNNWSEPWHLTANGKNVTVRVYREDLDTTACGTEFVYRILSAAATDDGGGPAAIGTTTTVDAYLAVSALNLSYMLDYAIVSNETIDIQSHVTVNGSVWLPYEEDLTVWPGGEITGENVTLEDGVSLTWPTFDQLSEYYLLLVDPEDPYPDDTVDISITKTLGPCYSGGDLAIDNTGDPDTLVLEGTVYVANGDLDFKQAGSRNYTIDLGGETIFVDGEIYFAPGTVTITGSGCIIARGDITFQPAISSAEDDFVLVMSIDGTTTFQPSGDLTGSVVGNFEVDVSPDDPHGDFAINWIPWQGQELNFPGLNETDPEDLQITALTIETWEINPE
jgi:hypothetical protein